jgi:hypothetical protein
MMMAAVVVQPHVTSTSKSILFVYNYKLLTLRQNTRLKGIKASPKKINGSWNFGYCGSVAK